MTQEAMTLKVNTRLYGHMLGVFLAKLFIPVVGNRIGCRIALAFVFIRIECAGHVSWRWLGVLK